MSSPPLVSVLIGTRNRVGPLAACLESVLSQTFEDMEVLVLDDASDMDINANLREYFPDSRIRWLRSEEPSGVAGARNKLIEASQSPLLIFMDDDAYFDDERCVERVVSHFQSASGVGIIAFKIVLRGADEGELQVPFSRRSIQSDPMLVERCQRVSYFVGAAHAIRRDVFEQCGLYQDNLVYGHEELDLSYSAIKHGFQIMYATDVVVSHAQEPSVVKVRRLCDTEFFYNSRNRLWVAYKHIPLPYLLCYTVGWTLYYGIRALRERSVTAYAKGVLAGVRGMWSMKRQPLEDDAVSYLKSSFGRLWY